jgi:MFS family permease
MSVEPVTAAKPPILAVVLSFIAQGIAGAIGGVIGFGVVSAIIPPVTSPQGGPALNLAGILYGFPTGVLLGVLIPGVITLALLKRTRRVLPALVGFIAGFLLGLILFVLVSVTFRLSFQPESFVALCAAYGFTLAALRGWNSETTSNSTRFILIHIAATLGGALIGAGIAAGAREWLLRDYLVGSNEEAANIALAMVLIYGFTSPPAAVLVSRFVLRQPGDVLVAIFLSEFFGLLLAFSLGYLGTWALLIPPLIGASLLTMTARGPGNQPGWGAHLLGNINRR